MPRPRPPHLHRETTRHKRPVWYVRVGKGPRIRIRADYGTPEFDAQYQAAINGEVKSRRQHATAGSLQWLIERFRETPAWLSLSPATRKKRENIFHQIIASAGRQPFTAIREADIATGRDRRGKTTSGAGLHRHHALPLCLGQGSGFRQSRSGRWRQIPDAEIRRGLSGLDRQRCRRLRSAMANRNQRTRLV